MYLVHRLFGASLLEGNSAASLSAGRLAPTLFWFPHDAFGWPNFCGFCVFWWRGNWKPWDWCWQDAIGIRERNTRTRNIHRTSGRLHSEVALVSNKRKRWRGELAPRFSAESWDTWEESGFPPVSHCRGSSSVFTCQGCDRFGPLLYTMQSGSKCPSLAPSEIDSDRDEITQDRV